MNIQEIIAKVFLTDVKPADIRTIGNGSTNLVYIVDRKTWWYIVCVPFPRSTTLAIKCTLFHGNVVYFISHNGNSYGRDKEIDYVQIRVHNIDHNESEWVIEYY